MDGFIPGVCIDFITIVAFIITIVNSLVLIIKFGNCRICSNCKRKRFEKKLLKKIKSIAPTYIFAPDRNGIYVAKNIIDRWNINVPLIPIKLYDRNLYSRKIGNPYIYVDYSAKYVIEEPLINFSADDRILIIDDVVITGDTLIKIQEMFKSLPNVNSKTVYTAALVVDSECFKLKSVPDYFVKQYATNSYKFTWRN